jgi:DNA-binding CsgD family transcriptional regulator
MPVGTLILNVFSLSTAAGALVGLAALFVLLRHRGLAFLFLFVLFLGIDYALGIVLFATDPLAPSAGFPELMLLSARARALMSAKSLCLLGCFVTGPLAVHALLGVPIRRGAAAALVAGAAAVYGLSLWQLLLGGTSLGLHPWLLVLPVFSIYALYVYCFFVLLAHRRRPRDRVARLASRSALMGLGCIIPAMAVEDLCSIVSTRPPRVLVDPLAFLFLTGATLFFVLLLVVRRGRAGWEREGLEAFGARYGLSDREREVAELLVEGSSYKEIATRLCISLDTVKTHASRVYRKSSTSGRVDLRHRIRAPLP